MSYANRERRTTAQVRACAILRRCGGCGKKRAFVCSGKFRVNANGRRLDIWLIYRCEKCGHTLNVPIYERVPPERLEPETYEGFLENDPELCMKYAGNRGFLKSLGYETVKG